MLPAKGIQLDGLQREDQRLLRVRAPQDRRLNLPIVPAHEPRLPSQLILPPAPFALQTLATDAERAATAPLRNVSKQPTSCGWSGGELDAPSGS
jgi:hypothetical protein